MISRTMTTLGHIPILFFLPVSIDLVMERMDQRGRQRPFIAFQKNNMKQNCPSDHYCQATYYRKQPTHSPYSVALHFTPLPFSNIPRFELR